MIHFTAGYYGDGSRKVNGVPSKNLASHIWYNLVMRPGRAFFVDGVCLNEGYLTRERCAEIEKELATEAGPDEDTAPYH
jgi:hypothetical protein